MRLLFLFLLIAGCQTAATPSNWSTIYGRQERAQYKRAVYRVKIPTTWSEISPINRGASETMTPNALYQITEGLSIAVYSFPTNSLEERLPSSVHIARWKEQFAKKGQATFSIDSLTQGGFFGTLFTAENSESKKIALHLQLDPEHYQTLFFLAASEEEKEHYKQMGADIIITSEGASALIDNHLEPITQFLHSFELIQPLPQRL